MDKKSDFDLINSSWDKPGNDLFGGDSSLAGDSFSISSPLDSMASSLSGLDDHRDILGNGSSFSGLDMHHGMDDVLGSSGSSFESAQPDNMQSSLSGSDIFKDLHSQKDNLGASGISDPLKSILASDSSSVDLSHSLDHSLSKSNAEISFGTLGSDLLGDYGNRNYQSEFLSGLSTREDTTNKEKNTSYMGDNSDDVMSDSGYSTLSQQDAKQSIKESQEDDSFKKVKSPEDFSSASDSDVHYEPEQTLKELVPVARSVDVSENAYQSDDSEDDNEVYFDNSASEKHYLSDYTNKTGESSESDSIEFGLFAEQNFESNWFEEYSGRSSFNAVDYETGYRSAMNNLVTDNYDYNYTGMQVSDAGWVAEEIEKYQSRENIGCGVIFIFVIMFFFVTVWLGFALIAIVGIVIGAVVSSKAGNRAKELFKTYYVEAILKKNIYLKSYQPNIVLGEDLNLLSLTTEQWNRSKVDDLIDGLYKGVRFTFKDIALDYNSGGKNSTTKNVFRGQVYETTLKQMSSNVRYVRNISPLMEFSGIDCYYNRYGSLESVSTIESPQFVDAMIKLYNNLPVTNLEVRLAGNRMRIVVETSEEWFELKGKLDDSVEQLNKEIGKMMVIVSFMKECGIVFDKVRA